jgi:hypothetical protein
VDGFEREKGRDLIGGSLAFWRSSGLGIGAGVCKRKKEIQPHSTKRGKGILTSCANENPDGMLNIGTFLAASSNIRPSFDRSSSSIALSPSSSYTAENLDFEGRWI